MWKYADNQDVGSEAATHLKKMCIRDRPQDAMSRHRGAKPPRRCGLLGEISLLSPGDVYKRQVRIPTLKAPLDVSYQIPAQGAVTVIILNKAVHAVLAPHREC